MKKIFIDKNEGVAEIVEKIIGEEEADIVLVIPKNSQLRDSVSNFHLIRREAVSSGKNLVVESVDDEVLALAKTSHIDATHPFFEGERKSSSFSDIVPRESKSKEPKTSVPAAKGRKIKDEQPPVAPFDRDKSTPAVVSVPQKTEKPNVAEDKEDKIVMSAAPAKIFLDTARGMRRVNLKLALTIAVPLLILLTIFFILNGFFNKADITISFTKVPWSYEHVLSVDKSVSDVDLTNNVLPGTLFSDTKNTVQPYPASAKQTVSLKAAGTITIYNAYSSAPQTLVAATRFATPDGKIFRISKAVVVPGAQIKDGKIISSSIDAQVIADQPGQAYNLGATPRLAVPGFKGSSRYDGFYGELKQGTSGGFIGEKAVPTADDISKAKDKTTKTLRDNLDLLFRTSVPPDCEVLDGAMQFNVTKLKVNEDTNASGSFSVFGEANMVALCFFRETGDKSLKSFLLAAVAKNNQNMLFDGFQQPNYSQIKVDLKSGKESFDVTTAQTLKPDFSSDDFRSKILGRKVADVRSMIAALPNLASAKISLWPIWLWSLPSNPSHVKITVN